MSNHPRDPTLHGLLNDFENIGGPEVYGPEGIALIIALWRKSAKLGWKESYTMTNTEIMVQTGIKSRETINSYRNKLVKGGLFEYTAPPRGQSRGEYTMNFHFNSNEPVQEMDHLGEGAEKAVQNMDHLGEVAAKAVQEMDHYTDNFSKAVGKPVQNMDHYGEVVGKVVQNMDTVLKDLITITTTSISESPTKENEEGEQDPFLQLLNAYCNLNKRFDIHVKSKEREAMGKMVAGGIPTPFTIRTMKILLEEKREREGESFILPTSFLYYENALWEAWRNKNSITATGSTDGEILSANRKTKQDKQFDLLDMAIEQE